MANCFGNSCSCPANSSRAGQRCGGSHHYPRSIISLAIHLPITFAPQKTMTNNKTARESRNFFLEGPAGRLEAILWKPAAKTPLRLAALVCHPHPLFGGTMHNKVVYQAAKSLDALG